MSTSLLTLYRNIADTLFYDGGTATSGSSTTILDTSGDSPMESQDSAKKFENMWTMIEADSAGTPLNVAEIRRVSTYAPSTSTLTVSRAFTNNVSNTQSYGLYNVPPTRTGAVKGILQFLNETLRHLFYWDDVLVTEVTDGDMETSGVTNWTESDSAILTTKSTTTGVVMGDQALTVDNNNQGANNYVQSVNVNVTEGEVYEVSVDCTPNASSSGILRAWDVTNSAEIDVTDAYDGRQTRRLWLRASIPTDCEQLAIRLVTVETAGIVNWDNLTVRNVQKKRFNMPSWFVNEKWFGGLWYWPPGAERNNAYSIDEWVREHTIWAKVTSNHTANNPYRLEFEASPPSGSHLFARVVRPYSEFTHSAANLTGSTTDADPDWVKAWVLFKIFTDRGDRENAGIWYRRAMALHRRWQPFIGPDINLEEPF